MTEDDNRYFKLPVNKRKQEAMKWWKTLIQSNQVTQSTMQIYAEDYGLKKGKFNPGHLQHFTYLAKHRKTLPYWDAFPLNLGIAVASDHFLDLNIHYLNYNYRERFLKLLYDNITNKNLSPTTKANINYAMVKEMSKFKFMQPCIKRHNFQQMKSPPIYIKPEHWKYAMFLPSEEFIGSTKGKVWQESSKMMKAKK